MRRISLLSVLGPVIGLVTLSLPASGQGFTSMLIETRGQLESLSLCLGPGFVPLQVLAQGLLSGYTGGGDFGGGQYGGGRNQWEPPPPPRSYSDSLEQDLKACRAAGRLKSEEKQALLDQVRKDIEIKAQDCRKFGMGRTVQVRVTTLKGSQADSGWEVYYRWNCASGFQPSEIRAQQLTSPATIQIPPGNYSIRAQKRLPTGLVNTETTTVVVGLEKTAEIQIAIP
jgi:hypothetical protein